MSFGIGDALLAALAGGVQKYGQDYEAEKAQSEADARAQAAAVAKENYEKRMAAYKVSLEPPKYQTYDDTADGKAGKRTVKQVFDPSTGQWSEQDTGFAPNKPVAPTTRNVIMGNNIATQQENPDTGQWDTIGAPGPRFAPQAGSDGLSAAARDFNFYNSLSPDAQAKYDRMRRGTDPDAPEKKADEKAREQTTAGLRDINKMDPIERTDALKAAGLDPSDPHAMDTYRANLLYHNQTTMGVNPFKSVAVSTSTSAPLLRSADAQTSPSPKSPYPDGTKVKGPDGRLYVVKNGQPVPVQ